MGIYSTAASSDCASSLLTRHPIHCWTRTNYRSITALRKIKSLCNRLDGCGKIYSSAVYPIWHSMSNGQRIFVQIGRNSWIRTNFFGFGDRNNTNIYYAPKKTRCAVTPKVWRRDRRYASSTINSVFTHPTHCTTQTRFGRIGTWRCTPTWTHARLYYVLSQMYVFLKGQNSHSLKDGCF